MHQSLAILGGPRFRTTAFPEEAPTIGQCEASGVSDVLEQRRLSLFSNANIVEFENAFAAYVGTRFAIAVNSCTAALHTALLAIGIGPGDEVILPVYTHMSTANAVMLAGAEPVFVDVDQENFNIDTSQLAGAYSTRTRAVIAVDLFGRVAPRNQLMAFCREHAIHLIEDCAQSSGARYDGRPVGSFDIGCHSFGEIKNITTAEGGMVTTDDEVIAQKARLVRHEGEAWERTGNSVTEGHPEGFLELIYGIGYPLSVPGHNYRMNALQAALGLCQIRKLDELNLRRIRSAHYYLDTLASYDCLVLPWAQSVGEHVYNRFVLRIKEQSLGLSRDGFLAALVAEGIPAGVYYPIPLNRHKVMKQRGYRCAVQAFPGAEAVCADQIVLPSYPALTESDCADVTGAIGKVIDAAHGDPDCVSRVEETAKILRAHYFGQFFTM